MKNVSITILIAAIFILGVVSIYFFIYKREPKDNNEQGGNEMDYKHNGKTPQQRNFSLDEYKCNDGSEVPTKYLGNVQKNMDNLQVLRDTLGVPIIILSAYRSPSHNTKVGGATNSLHLRAMATDIKVPGFTPKEVANEIEQLIAKGKMTQGGIGIYSTFTHYDVRGTKARWNG